MNNSDHSNGRNPQEPTFKNPEQSGAATLLLSVILSSPGPLVVGIGVLLGRSSTQLADFIRRTAELCAILVSYFIYRVLHKDGAEPEPDHKMKLERTANLFVGAAMCLSGIIMFLIAILSDNTEKGNVIPGLVIAFLGLVTNSWFWIRYTSIYKQNGDIILRAQSQLYRAKSFVDAAVFAALLVVTIAPRSAAAYWVDIIGAVIVSIYLVINGIIIFKNSFLVVRP